MFDSSPQLFFNKKVVEFKSRKVVIRSNIKLLSPMSALGIFGKKIGLTYNNTIRY